MKLSEHARIGIGVLVIGLAVLFLYRAILFVPADPAQYPWGSDTLGHVFRAEYLRQQMAAGGSVYPDLFPDWYMGIQLLRYYPPLPYYVIIGLQAATGDALTAANWFLAVCALAGGLTWLLYRRWIGWLPAITGGVLFVFLPDNLRVAFAEGNLPRALATALLPLAFFFLLRVLDQDGARWHGVGLALTFAAILFSHAMMAAIYAASAILFCLAAGLARASTPRRLAAAVSGVALGVLLSGWWLLPSLTGGITELNSAAVTEALATFPLHAILNPWGRADNPEAIYVGAVLLVAAAAAAWVRPGRNGNAVALLFTGLFGVLIATPGTGSLMSALPFHNLLWPVRFLGMASFMLLLALMWCANAWAEKSKLLVVVVVALLAADSAGSLFLIHLRPLQPDTLPISQALSRSQGWRQATLDLSRLGSEPSYFYATVAGREQLYGWAYQGARTARPVAALNEAVEAGFVGYIVDRLALYGADDVVLLKGLAHAPAVASGLAGAGFVRVYQGTLTDLFHRDGAPRGSMVNSPALGIGRGAQNLSYLFPQILLGTSPNLEAYAFEDLIRYDTLFLSGFTWNDRSAAEGLVKRVAAAGVNVVVDLTDAPEDPLARIPRFLDVWGERIILAPEPLSIQGSGTVYHLKPPGDDGGLWYTHTPQGAAEVTLTLDYLGETATVLGYNDYGPGRVWFIGMNLPYHAVVTQDAEAVRLLADLLDLTPGAPSNYTTIPLNSYRADRNGYQFQVELNQAATLLVPVAYHDGMRATVDGVLVKINSFENLVAFTMPAGSHRIEIRLHRTGIYGLGWFASGLALAGLVRLWTWEKRP